MRTLECKKCQHQWIPKKKNPIVCPYCHYRLNKGMIQNDNTWPNRKNKHIHTTNNKHSQPTKPTKNTRPRNNIHNNTNGNTHPNMGNKTRTKPNNKNNTKTKRRRWIKKIKKKEGTQMKTEKEIIKMMQKLDEAAQYYQTKKQTISAKILQEQTKILHWTIT